MTTKTGTHRILQATAPLCLAALAGAQQPLRPDEVPPSLEPTAVSESIPSVDGKELHDSVRKVVRGLTWHTRLERAQRCAAADDKPILWIQALGDLDGFT